MFDQPCLCLLCRKLGRPLRHRQPAELARSYHSHFGTPLPDELVRKYFTEPVQEFECRSCGLRWYAPNALGEGDYYAVLGALYPWYYGQTGWDRQAALDWLRQAGARVVVEVGCGKGSFLQMLKRQGMEGIGIDINSAAVAEARANGLRTYLPGEQPMQQCDALCLFQTIEHVDDPVPFLRGYVEETKPRDVLLSAPAFDSLLGYASDPLSWPPHHRSAWSARGFATLASKVGLKLKEVSYQPLLFGDFVRRQRLEPRNRFVGLPRLPEGRLGGWAFRFLQGVGLNWAQRGHSILVRMGLPNP
jgi:SAM-dependent methyltransferase